MEIIITLLYVVLALVCVFLIVIILLQEEKGGGLAGFLGGSDSPFGAQHKPVSKVTAWAAGIFIFLCIFIVLLESQAQKDEKPVPIKTKKGAPEKPKK